jgi:uncharacterized ferritin-like protein (DUF455 family)
MDEEGADKPLIALFSELQRAPSVAAFLQTLGGVLLPSLKQAYQEFLRKSDPIADAPTHRFLALALTEKQKQIATITRWTKAEIARQPKERAGAVEWASAVRSRLDALGGVGTDQALPEGVGEPLAGGRDYSIPDHPARDERFWACRYYWPDNVDAKFPYGEGLSLRIRSAVSHLNEVWAVETGGVILNAFAGLLPWEWIRDAARWTYDEARHCRMGYARLTAWGFDLGEIPLGTYIYDSAAGVDPIYRLGMLFFFETKNIGRKPERIHAFQRLGDAVSEHDMDFDWADETIHAGYGKKWLQKILEARGEDPARYDDVRLRCAELIAAEAKKALPEEIAELTKVARSIVAKAERMKP